MIELQKAEGASLAWKENSPGDKELFQDDVVTVQVGPDSIYGLSEYAITGNTESLEAYRGFKYDTIAIITVTNDGKLILSKKHVQSKIN